MRCLLGLGLFLLCGCAAAAPPGLGSPALEDDPRVASTEPADEPDAASPPRALAARTGNAWTDCYRAFEPTDDAAVDLEHLTRSCAGRAGFAPLTPVHVGSQREQGRVERLSVPMRRGRCYRAFAIGARGVVDLDLALFDPQGGLVAADLSLDRWSVAPPRGPFCAARGGLYRLDLAVTAGGGDYVAQIWGTPDEALDGSGSDDE